MGLFSLCLFASAFCLFWGQLLVGKLLLPVWGGSPLVWNTCLAFFQVVLALGYLWADRLQRWLAPKWGVLLHWALLVAGFGFLPFRLGNLEGEQSPLVALWVQLTLRVGEPLLLLSATTPLVQAWFAMGRGHRWDPYVLYVASNAGSLAGLLAYPLLLEPRFSLTWQTRLWAMGYGLVCGLVLLCGWGLLGEQTRGRKDHLPQRGNPERLAAGDPWRWAALAFVPSGLLVAVTQLLTTDVAAVPLLWVIPLAIALLTCMLAFAGYPLPRGGAEVGALLICLALGMQALGWVKPLFLVLPLHGMAFALACWGCYGELAQRRPPVEHLTQFYLWLALGGGLGGLFAALVAVQVFPTLLEYPLLLALSLWVMAARGARVGLWLGLGLILPLLVLRFRLQACLSGGCALGLGLGLGWLWLMRAREPLTGKSSPWTTAASWVGISGGMLLLLGQPWLQPGLEVIHLERNAFGLNRIVEYHSEAGSFRGLLHGTTLHGSQNLDPQQAAEPLTYFSRSGPVGQVFALLRQSPRHPQPQIAVLGLGIGTLAAYAQPGDSWTFFELDPAVERLARRYFSYLSSSPAPIQVRVGDARLALTRIPDGTYDLLVLDAFSSDAVPVHLLTQEALTLYLRKLRPEGGLLVNITNRHLNLAPVLAGLAGHLQVHAWQQVHRDLLPAERQAGLAPSHWVLLTAAPTAWRMPDPWQPLLPQAGDPLWRDDFSNLLQVIRWPWQAGDHPTARSGETPQPSRKI